MRGDLNKSLTQRIKDWFRGMASWILGPSADDVFARIREGEVFGREGATEAPAAPGARGSLYMAPPPKGAPPSAPEPTTPVGKGSAAVKYAGDLMKGAVTGTPQVGIGNALSSAMMLATNEAMKVATGDKSGLRMRNIMQVPENLYDSLNLFFRKGWMPKNSMAFAESERIRKGFINLFGETHPKVVERLFSYGGTADMVVDPTKQGTFGHKLATINLAVDRVMSILTLQTELTGLAEKYGFSSVADLLEQAASAPKLREEVTLAAEGAATTAEMMTGRLGSWRTEGESPVPEVDINKYYADAPKNTKRMASVMQAVDKWATDKAQKFGREGIARDLRGSAAWLQRGMERVGGMGVTPFLAQAFPEMSPYMFIRYTANNTLPLMLESIPGAGVILSQRAMDSMMYPVWKKELAELESIPRGERSEMQQTKLSGLKQAISTASASGVYTKKQVMRNQLAGVAMMVLGYAMRAGRGEDNLPADELPSFERDPKTGVPKASRKVSNVFAMRNPYVTVGDWLARKEMGSTYYEGKDEADRIKEHLERQINPFISFGISGGSLEDFVKLTAHKIMASFAKGGTIGGSLEAGRAFTGIEGEKQRTGLDLSKGVAENALGGALQESSALRALTGAELPERLNPIGGEPRELLSPMRPLQKTEISNQLPYILKQYEGFFTPPDVVAKLHQIPALDREIQGYYSDMSKRVLDMFYAMKEQGAFPTKDDEAHFLKQNLASVAAQARNAGLNQVMLKGIDLPEKIEKQIADDIAEEIRNKRYGMFKKTPPLGKFPAKRRRQLFLQLFKENPEMIGKNFPLKMVAPPR